MRLATVAAALFGLVLAAPARADVGDYVSRPIATVTLRLDGRDVSDQRILDLVQTRVGQPLAMQAVRESIVHLFSLAQSFTTFYEACPVLAASTPQLRASRLALCELTGRVLVQGMDLLGVTAPDQM